MLKGIHLDETYLHNVGHILFKTETFKNMTDTSKLTGKTKELADRLVANGIEINAANMAKELLKVMFENGEITAKTENGHTYYVMDKTVFERYGTLYNEDSNIFYDDVYEGQMVEEFEDWMMDASRRDGEISYPAAIETSYGQHIMYYVSKGDMQWQHDIKEKLFENDYNAWYDGVAAACEIKVEDKYWSSIQ